MKKFLLKCAGAFAALALTVGVASSQGICIVYFHQPEVPAALRSDK